MVNKGEAAQTREFAQLVKNGAKQHQDPKELASPSLCPSFFICKMGL